MLLGHLLVLLLPLIALVLEGLHLAFKVAGLNISLAKPVVWLARERTTLAGRYSRPLLRVP